MTEAEFQEAFKVFSDIIKFAIFFIAADQEEETKVKDIIATCTEYIYFIRLSALSDGFKGDKVKYAETACLMSLCKLESPIHKFLVYKKAKIACKNIKNYITAVAFLKKILAMENEVIFKIYSLIF